MFSYILLVNTASPRFWFFAVLIIFTLGLVVTISIMGPAKFLALFAGSTTRKRTTAAEVQDAKNRAYIAKLIDGHYTRLPQETRERAKQAFATWQAFQKKFHAEAPKKYVKECNKYFRDKGWQAFQPKISYEPPTPGLTANSIREPVKMFIADVFTEPFPSTHDMADWHLTQQIADIMILHGITPEQSKHYYVHIKYHFVNHSMVRGIIQFDLYAPVEVSVPA